jgi:hypothetical protein
MTAANSINVSSAGIVGFNGNSFDETALTAHNVLVGGATSDTIVNVAPSATAGVALVSNGAAADPHYSTVVVAGGGTGQTSLTAYELIAGGTTSTSAVQSIGIGTSGQVLKSNGAGALPSFQASSFSPFPWTDEATTFSAVSENGYFVTAASTANLPAGTQGATIEFVNAGAGAAGIVVTANGTDIIQIGSAVSAAGGTATSNVSGDFLSLTYQLASTTWFGTGVQGTWPVV